MSPTNISSTNNWTPTSIRELAYAFQKSRTFLTAYDLAIFTAIGNDAKNATDVATTLNADIRATERLLNALVGFGLLTKREDLFSNTDFSKIYLVKSSPEYLGGIAHAENLWRNWSTLTASVIAGTCLVERRFSHPGSDPTRGFIAAMHDRARPVAPVIANQIDWTGISRVIDIGGGSGVYSIAFVYANPALTATVFDLPAIIPLTKEYIATENLVDRIDTREGDYLLDELGTGYDLAFLSAVIHSNSAEENKHLMKQCAAALNPGGKIVIQDFVMDEDRTTPEQGALFALNMLVATPSGDTYTETEITEWLQEAGFHSIYRHETGFGTTQMIGTLES